jgi:hypothetical protein
VPPDRLIDRSNGTVILRLVPHYLERLHGASGVDESVDFRALGLPFPFLRGGRSFDITLRQGMSPSAIGSVGGFEPNSSLGVRSWWRWASYALTPFGWAAHPTSFFDNGRLSMVQLDRVGNLPNQSFDAIVSWLVRELGEPPESTVGAMSPSHTMGNHPPEPPRRQWVYPWGSVTAFFEARDGDARLSVAWDSA